MGKVIQIQIPEWIDEKEIERVIEVYLETKLSDKVSREEYLKLVNVSEEEIVEFDYDTEIKTLEKLREKARKRCQF